MLTAENAEKAAEGAEKRDDNMAPENKITESIIAGAIEVHRALGPGLLESTYEACLAAELEARGHAIQRQKALPVTYKGLMIDCAYRIDLVVDGQVIVELKAVQALDAIHEAQVLSYLKLSGCQVALLINFNVTLLKKGVKRFVHGLPE